MSTTDAYLGKCCLLRVKTHVFILMLADMLLSCPSPFPSPLVCRRQSRTMTKSYQCWVYFFSISLHNSPSNT